ncbi:hypothetical protein Tco_1128545, partial [Tanacetum coccineum]
MFVGREVVIFRLREVSFYGAFDRAFYGAFKLERKVHRTCACNPKRVLLKPVCTFALVSLKGVGLRVADFHTSNHREDDFTPLETFR